MFCIFIAIQACANERISGYLKNFNASRKIGEKNGFCLFFT